MKGQQTTNNKHTTNTDNRRAKSSEANNGRITSRFVTQIKSPFK